MGSPRLARALRHPLHEVERERLLAGVVDSVRHVRGGEHDRAGPDLGGLAVADDLTVSGLDDQDFLVGMNVRGWGDLPGSMMNRPVTRLEQPGVSPWM